MAGAAVVGAGAVAAGAEAVAGAAVVAAAAAGAAGTGFSLPLPFPGRAVTFFPYPCAKNQSFFVKQIILFASLKFIALWNLKLLSLSISQSLANSLQPLSFAHISHSFSSSLA